MNQPPSPKSCPHHREPDRVHRRWHPRTQDFRVRGFWMTLEPTQWNPGSPQRGTLSCRVIAIPQLTCSSNLPPNLELLSCSSTQKSQDSEEQTQPKTDNKNQNRKINPPKAWTPKERQTPKALNPETLGSTTLATPTRPDKARKPSTQSPGKAQTLRAPTAPFSLKSSTMSPFRRRRGARRRREGGCESTSGAVG